MNGLKYLFLIIFLFSSAICRKIPTNAGNSSDFNSVQRKENAVIITGNENLIFPRGKPKDRLLKINLTRADVNDGKVSAQKDMTAGKKSKSGKIKFEIDELFFTETTTKPWEISTTKEYETEILEIIAQNSTSDIATRSNQSLAREIRSKMERATDKEEIAENPLQEKIRKPVKLNMKQGLIMNQVLNTYALNDVNNSLCRDHINEFKLGLRALEPWAIKMFDASSKLMSGILGGNLAELGAFDQCLNIREETYYGTIKGRHCTLHINPPDELVKIVLKYRKPISDKYFQNLKDNLLDGIHLTWSVCVPDSCNHEEVLRHFSKSILDVTEGLNLTLSLTKEHCLSLDDLPKFSKGDYIYMLVVSLVIIFVVICTIIDTFNEDNSYEYISLFSIKRNASFLFSTRENKNDIACLHGLRFLSMYLVIYGHRYIHDMATPVVNYIDLVDWLETYYSTTIHGGTTTVDTFFLISSTLLSYTFFNMLSNGIKIDIILFYLHRHLRLLVPLALAVGFYATISKHLGGGPIYNDMIAFHGKACEYFWWSAMLYIQPFVNPRMICIVQTWFLSVDMFWYYCSPFMLLALAKNQITGYSLLMAVYTTCTVVNFYVAWVYEFNGQMPVTPGLLSSDYFALHYVQPIVRGGPYILGLAFGHALFRTKDQKVTITVFTKTTGWILVSVGLPSVVLVTRSFRQQDFEYNRAFASVFLACHRSIWAFTIMWIIWCCQNGYGGLVNGLLSWKGFKVLGRLCYNIYLFHYMFQGAMESSKREPTYFSNLLSIYHSFSDITLMSLLSIPISLCFEYPFTRMFGLLLKPKNKGNTTKVKPQTNEKA